MNMTDESINIHGDDPDVMASGPDVPPSIVNDRLITDHILETGRNLRSRFVPDGSGAKLVVRFMPGTNQLRDVPFDGIESIEPGAGKVIIKTAIGAIALSALAFSTVVFVRKMKQRKNQS